MATFKKLPSGNWRVQIRRKGRYVSETFRRKRDAEAWTLDAERRIDRGESPPSRARSDPTTFGHLIDLHLADMQEVGRPPRRSKAFSLDALKAKLGKVKLKDIDRERLIQFRWRRNANSYRSLAGAVCTACAPTSPTRDRTAKYKARDRSRLDLLFRATGGRSSRTATPFC